jgi:hypothetical protein
MRWEAVAPIRELQKPQEQQLLQAAPRLQAQVIWKQNWH